MKRKFLTMFLSGKAAVMPALVQQAYAMVPTFADAVNVELTQIEVPTATVTQSKAVRLDSMGTATENGQAYLCTNSGVIADKLSLVITGLKTTETVIVVASPTLGSALEAQLDSRLKVNLLTSQVVLASVINGPVGDTLSLSTTVDLSVLQTKGFVIAAGSRFYLQTVVFPPNTITATGIQWGMLRYSELDSIVVDQCATSTYGTPY